MTLREVVNTDVDDLEKAIEFYSAAFDLHLGRRLFNGSVAEMVGATSTLHLLAILARPSRFPPPQCSASTSGTGRPCTWTSKSKMFPWRWNAPLQQVRLEGEIRSFPWGCSRP